VCVCVLAAGGGFFYGIWDIYGIYAI